MIANFFQSLERNGTEYLLISGQAAVLYGAATFSEDIDLWINPTEENLGRMLEALRQHRARYYKLTPPFTPTNLQRGHGFHFILPETGAAEVFLDVMGKPPRTESFTAAAATARHMETEWGLIPTIGIKPLVELKKTQRLEDYPIISKLALAWLDPLDHQVAPDDLAWALQNIFTLAELTQLCREHPAIIKLASTVNSGIAEFGRQLISTGEVEASVESRVANFFQDRISEHQSADRHYWRGIIQELKALRSGEMLLREGQTV